MNTKDVILNSCYGGFSLSKEAYKELGMKWDDYGYAFSGCSIEERSNPDLVRAVRKLGADKSSGAYADLRIVTIPANDRSYYIEEHDGYEHIARYAQCLEPKYLINCEDETRTLEELEEANSEDPDVVLAIRMLLPNEEVTFGGGAQPETKIKRII